MAVSCTDPSKSTGLSGIESIDMTGPSDVLTMGGRGAERPVKIHHQRVKVQLCEKLETDSGHDFRDLL